MRTAWPVCPGIHDVSPLRTRGVSMATACSASLFRSIVVVMPLDELGHIALYISHAKRGPLRILKRSDMPLAMPVADNVGPVSKILRII